MLVPRLILLPHRSCAPTYATKGCTKLNKLASIACWSSRLGPEISSDICSSSSIPSWVLSFRFSSSSSLNHYHYRLLIVQWNNLTNKTLFGNRSANQPQLRQLVKCLIPFLSRETSYWLTQMKTFLSSCGSTLLMTSRSSLPWTCPTISRRFTILASPQLPPPFSCSYMQHFPYP